MSFFQFTLRVFVALFVVSLLNPCYLIQVEAAPKIEKLDTDEDGKIDRWNFYNKKGKLRRIGKDTNGDGKIDKSRYLVRGRAETLHEADKNFDGEVDDRRMMTLGYDNRLQITRNLYIWRETDEDFDGVIDTYRVRGIKEPDPDKTGQVINPKFMTIADEEAQLQAQRGGQSGGVSETGVETLLKRRQGEEDLYQGSREKL